MVKDEQLLEQLERLLGQINAELKQILPTVTDPAFTDSDVRKAIQKVERLSRWRRSSAPGGPEGYDVAAAKAHAKAKEYGEPFVVAETDDGQSLVVISKARLLEEKPFGLDEKNICYETEKATA